MFRSALIGMLTVSLLNCIGADPSSICGGMTLGMVIDIPNNLSLIGIVASHDVMGVETMIGLAVNGTREPLGSVNGIHHASTCNLLGSTD